jgi:hypothetical protein
MPERFTIDMLLRTFEPIFAQLPDHRAGRNTTYPIPDAVRLARPRFADRASCLCRLLHAIAIVPRPATGGAALASQA